jgi:tetratricopeptide (TPR) repeat protein
MFKAFIAMPGSINGSMTSRVVSEVSCRKDDAIIGPAMRLAAPSSRLIVMLTLGISLSVNLQAQDHPASILHVKTLPGAIVWVDSLRYGVVPESGELTVKNLRAGAHTVRARLKGKREITRTVRLVADSQESIQLALSAPADKAELSFQTAEELRERGKHADAIKEYRNAIKLRPRGYPTARLGLARSLMASEKYAEAVAEARRAMRENPGPYPEAHVVIANTKRTQGFYDDAITSYRTALVQARDISPEAHTGVAITYQDRNLAEEAIKHFRKAIVQANDTEPIIYFLLGSALEREYRNREAVEAYEIFLQLDPNHTQASAVRSVIKQLRREIR